MANNWVNVFFSNSMQPETVDEAVELLISILEDRHKILLSILKEDELIDLHFGLGLSIRNAFGLHDPGSKLLASCGVVHPDDASGVIIQALWIKLTRGVHTTTKRNE